MEEPPTSSPGGEWTQRKPWRSSLLRMSLEAAFRAPTQGWAWRQPCWSSHLGMRLGQLWRSSHSRMSLEVFVEELPTRDEPGGSGGGGTTRAWTWSSPWRSSHLGISLEAVLGSFLLGISLGAAVKEFPSGDQAGGSHGGAPPGWNEPRTRHGRSWILIVGIEPRGPRGRSLRSNAPFTRREHHNNQSTPPWCLSPSLTTLISIIFNYRSVLRELILA